MIDYQLWLGDCLQEMDRIEDKSIDAIIADWPYQTTNCHWDKMIPLEPLWKQCKRVIKRNGAIVLFGSQPFTSMLVMSNLEWFKYDLVWNKQFGTDWPRANLKPLNSHESILVFSGGKTTYNPQKQPRIKPRDRTGESGKSVWNSEHRMFSSKQYTGNKIYFDKFPLSVINLCSQESECNNVNKLHSTQKPLSLLEYLVKIFSDPGDLILDNTFGSCTTGVAAIKHGRRFIGIEKDPHYFEIGRKRMEDAARELRGEWKPLKDDSNLEGLPLFAS